MDARPPARIAPAGSLPAPREEEATHPVLGSATLTPGVREGDIVISNGTAFNGRGYRVCGVRNQRGTLCGRIGTCPFHSRKRKEDVGGGTGTSTSTAAGGTGTLGSRQPGDLGDEANEGLPRSVLRMQSAPEKSKFKRTWSSEEHRLFLVALQKHGRGKWKEISREIGSRTANQCQSHAQKYFLRQAKDKSSRVKQSIHDLTIDDFQDKVHEASSCQTGTRLQDSTVSKVRVSKPAVAKLRVSKSGASKLSAPKASLVKSNATGSTHPAKVSPPVVMKDLITASQSNVHMHDSSMVDSVRDQKRTPQNRLKSGSGAARRVGVNGKPASKPEHALHEDAELLLSNFRETIARSEAVQHTRLPVSTGPLPPTSRSAGRTEPNSNETSNRATVPIMIPVAALPALAKYAQLVQSSCQNDTVSVPWSAMPRQGESQTEIEEAVKTPRMTVHVQLNGMSAPGHRIVLPDSMEMDEFLAGAAELLGVPATLCRVFTRSGAEISCLDELCEEEALWLSEGPDFLFPPI